MGGEVSVQTIQPTSVPTTDVQTMTFVGHNIIMTHQNNPNEYFKLEKTADGRSVEASMEGATMKGSITKDSFSFTSRNKESGENQFYLRDPSIDMTPDNWQVQIRTVNDQPTDYTFKSGNTSLQMSNTKPFVLTTPTANFQIEKNSVCMDGVCHYSDFQKCQKLSIINGSVLCNNEIIHEFHKKS